MNDDTQKNTLPRETDDRTPSDMPRQLRTQADDVETLTAHEASIAGITEPVYGDDSTNPNADDRRSDNA